MTIISSFQNQYVEKLNRANILNVIPFGIDRSYFFDLTGSREIDILGVGSLNRIKNYGQFVEIIESIAKEYPGIRCKIIGEGSKRTDIEKIIIEKGLEENIMMAGNLRYEKTIEEMHHGKILLHTSTFEGQALVITEALASGLYVVCHPVGIAASLKSAKLFTCSTNDEMVNQILLLLLDQHPDHNAEIHYTIDDTCREYHKIYKA